MRKAFIIYDEEFNILGVITDTQYKTVEDLNKAIDNYLHVPESEDDFYNKWFEIEEFELNDSFKQLYDRKISKNKRDKENEKTI